MRRIDPRLLVRIGDAVAVLWPAGCMLLQLNLVSSLLRPEGEAGEWIQYLLLGTLFPAMLLAISTLGAFFRPAQRVLSLVKLGLAAYAVAACGTFAARSFSLPIALMAAVQMGLIALWGSSRLQLHAGVAELEVRFRTLRDAAGRSDLPTTIAGAFLCLVSWLVAVRMVWWTSFTTWVGDTPYTSGVLLAAIVLVTANLFGNRHRAHPTRHWQSAVGTLLALLVIGLVSLRVDSLGGSPAGSRWHDRGEFTLHHWAAITAPADLVRQGGWLLWDVPSQYGFLSALALAAMPMKSIWQSFYVLNAILMFASGAFVFLIYRSLHNSRLNVVFALMVALAAVFMVHGWARPLEPTGPHLAPAIGAYRFVFCYALLAALVWEFGTDPRSRNPHPLLVGNLCWLLGVLWSAESGAYCTAIWLPAYLAVLARRALALEPGREVSLLWLRIRLAGAWLAVPAVLLAVCWAGISAYYLARLGHGPDWQGYIEYAAGAKVFCLPIKPDGTVLILLLILAILSTLAVSCAGRSRKLGALALIGGAWGAFWAVSSYFVGRSHEVNAVNINPVVFAAIGVGLYLLDRDRATDRLAPLFKIALAPVLTVLVTMAFGVPAQLPNTLAALRRGYLHRIDTSLPRMDPTLAALLDRTRVRFHDRVATAAYGWPLEAREVSRGKPGAPPRVLSYRNWSIPIVLLLPLSEERRALYLQRHAERTNGKLWLVIPPDPRAKEIVEHHLGELQRFYRAAESHQLGPWRLSRYEVKRQMRVASAPAKVMR